MRVGMYMKNFSFEIEKIFIDSASITEEKCRYYSSEKEIDSSYLEEWRSARTLLNDNYFKEMLEIKNTSLQEFSFALQPLGIGNYKEVQWF
ncbi:MAG TPA: hypothetical protein DCR07_01100, partial [Lactococcus sp.]|nr:hypothetical protein [Lactococcus sp.]